MPMHNPLHTGGIVRRQCLEPLGLSVTGAAKGLGVTHQALSRLVNGRAGISVDMAVRLSKAFGSSPETWLHMQTANDLRQARERAERGRVLSNGAVAGRQSAVRRTDGEKLGAEELHKLLMHRRMDARPAREVVE